MRWIKAIVVAVTLALPTPTPGATEADAFRATIMEFGALNRAGRFEEAEQVALRLIALAEARSDVDGGLSHAQTLGLLANLYVRQGRYAEAEPLYQRSLALKEAELGADHRFVAGALANFATLYFEQGRYAEAERLDLRSLGIREAALGPDHPEVARSLNSLATLFSEQGRYAEAEAFFQRSLAIEEAALGPDHPNIAANLSNLAVLYSKQGRYAEAEALLQRSLAIREASLGPNHPDMAFSLNNLADVYSNQGRYAEAEPLWRRGVAIQAAALGPDHPSLAVTLGNLASLYETQGRYAEAEPLYKRSLAIQEAALGPEHPDVATPLNNLARLYAVQGRHAEATSLRQRSLVIREVALRSDHPDVALSVNSLAHGLIQQGRHAEAEPLLQRSLAISETALGPEHPTVATILNNLAIVYRNQGRHDEAAPLYQRSLAIQEAALGPDHPSVANVLNGLALIHTDLGQFAEAETLYERSLAISETAQGPEHPTVATILNNFAWLYFVQDRYIEATRLYRRSLAIREAALGPNHPSLAPNLQYLSLSLLGDGRVSEALSAARRSLFLYQALSRTAQAAAEEGNPLQSAEAAQAGLDFRWIAWVASGTLGRAVFQVDDWMTGIEDAVIDWVVAAVGGDDQEPGRRARKTPGLSAPENQPDALRAEAFAAAQSASGGGATEAIQFASARVAAGVEGLEGVVDEWEGARAERAALDGDLLDAASTGASPERRAALEARRVALDERIAATDARLRSDYPRFFELVSPGSVTVAELQDDAAPLLGESEALVLLSPGHGADIGFVWAVSREAVAWAQIELTGDALSAQIGGLRAVLAAGGQRDYDRWLAHELYQALFGDPAIAAVLAEKEDWILVPQGPLLSLPFAALVTAPPEGRDDDAAALRATPWLGVERALSVLPSVSSLRALRRMAAAGAADRAPFFGLGDPAFEGEAGDARGESQLASAKGLFRDAVGDVNQVRQLSRLPGTRQEVETMAAAFGVGRERFLLGAEANERRLADPAVAARLSEARVVLLATHGLMAGGFGGTLAEPALALTPPDEPVAIDDLGAASPGAAALMGARIDDGLLTASEAARLDLDADWVILSACDTAAGDRPDAAGLSGLARAFFYAGARAMLVSHWEVYDIVAARLTLDAVQRAETGDLSRARAFRDAMRALIDDDSLDAEAISFAHPAVWAPFQIVGAS